MGEGQGTYVTEGSGISDFIGKGNYKNHIETSVPTNGLCTAFWTTNWHYLTVCLSTEPHFLITEIIYNFAERKGQLFIFDLLNFVNKMSKV